MKSILRVVMGVMWAAMGALQAMAGTRFHEYTAKYKVSPCPATPVAAGYFGGGGNDYLSGGAFLVDGSVVLAGTALGPVFDPAGPRPRVLGADGPPPAGVIREEKDRKGKVHRIMPDWTSTDGAGFLAQLAPEGAGIRQVIRFPWGSGALTDVLTDAQGAVYVAGVCGPRFGSLVQATRLETGFDGKGVIFLGRLKPDWSGFAWCHPLADDLWTAPRLKLIAGERISLLATHAYHFDASGRLLKATRLQTTRNWVRGVDPVTHATATGGDSMTHTGWEPWRKPALFIFNDKGEQTDVFYRWNEKLVGLNNSRLVSDSAVRALAYDRQGNLLISGWSDGGNSVFEYMPYDYRTGIYTKLGTQGLGFSLWGANAGSFCHLIKIDPRSGEPLGKTIFTSYLAGENKPSGLRVHGLDSAADDSLMLAGSSAFGLIETGDKVNTLDHAKGDFIGGNFVAILSPRMDCLRFSSCMPGGGVVPLLRHGENSFGYWGMASAAPGGKRRALFVGGAESDAAFKPVNAVQRSFGGGALDGQYVILGL